MNRKGLLICGMIACAFVIGILYLFSSFGSNAIVQPESISATGSDGMYEYTAIETWCENDQGQKIYGISYVPETDEKVPLVIFAHELCNTHTAGTSYAEALAYQGIAAYTFDFRGGSYSSRSDGKTTEMSVMTEADDLKAVVQAAKQWDFVDDEKIVIIGGSQGGVAASVYASEHSTDIAGLVLLYPAFVIQDEIHAQFRFLNDVPETFNFLGWIQVGKNYASDVWDYDFYGVMEKFGKPVLILHGNRDYMVDVSYSEKAADSFPDAELHILNGAGHGFYGKSFDEAITYIFAYLNEQII